MDNYLLLFKSSSPSLKTRLIICHYVLIISSKLLEQVWNMPMKRFWIITLFLKVKTCRQQVCFRRVWIGSKFMWIVFNLVNKKYLTTSPQHPRTLSPYLYHTKRIPVLCRARRIHTRQQHRRLHNKHIYHIIKTVHN